MDSDDLDNGSVEITTMTETELSASVIVQEDQQSLEPRTNSAPFLFEPVITVLVRGLGFNESTQIPLRDTHSGGTLKSVKLTEGGKALAYYDNHPGDIVVRFDVTEDSSMPHYYDDTSDTGLTSLESTITETVWDKRWSSTLDFYVEWMGLYDEDDYQPPQPTTVEEMYTSSRNS